MSGTQNTAAKDAASKIISNVNKVIVGKDDQIRLLMVALLTGGHVLLEDVPGTGKTKTARALAQSLKLDFKRVALMPGTGKFQYRDTRFVARCKAYSGLDCYNRIVDHLSQRVDRRSQFPSSKGKNFKFTFLGECK